MGGGRGYKTTLTNCDSYFHLDERVEQLPTKCATVFGIKDEPSVLGITGDSVCYDLGGFWLCCHVGKVSPYYDTKA